MSRAHDTGTEWISLVELLGLRAREKPDQCLFAFLPDGEDGGAITLTRGELDRRARALAARLQGLGLAGQRALLLYPPGLGFVEAFCGCLYAGVVAVPAYPPRVNRPMTRLQSIVCDAHPSVVLTCASQSKDALRWESGVPELRGVHRLVTDGEGEDLDELAGGWSDLGAERDTLAFLQYTSGSTAAPRGVMITHGNLLHNSALIHDCFGSTPEDRGVFWLPLFHDMGLIGGVIHTIYCGGSSTLLSPVHFLHRPIRWLQVISRTGATISGAPNFAYELCIEKTTPEQRANLDLSCWRVAFNGAETVRPETLDRFARAFAPAGFRREAFLPCYGLAEATLLVSGGPSGSPPVVLSVDAEALGRGEVAAARQPHRGKCLASSGEVAASHRVAIVDPSTRSQCTEDRIGEIWVSGPSVAGGYWGRTDETQETLRANLCEGGAGPFLRTGDLGFLKDGMLFVTGRLKDLIILRGRNVYPQDVEWTAERCHPALCTGGAAAFAVEVDGEEQLAIVQELNRHFDRAVTGEVIAAIRRAIALQFDIEVHAIRLIQPLSLPQTSSGKVQRHVCRQGFLAGSLEIVAEWTRQKAAGPSLASKSSDAIERSNMGTPVGPRSANAIVAWLTERISGPLGIRPDEVDTKKPLAGYGLGSLQAVQLASELEQWLGLKLPPTLAYDYPTIDALAHVLSGASSSQEDGRKVQPGRREDREPIAIIGIGCRFPGANGPVGFWRLLRDGVDAVGPIPASRWDDEALRGLDIPRRGGFLAEVDQFDADFFGISPREAVFVDPQHRLLLEVTWEAIEDGGQAPERLAGAPVGVFVGISTNDYAQLQAMRGGASDGYRITGSAASIAANRISHHFDFRGPSLTIDTACSSSMVAVHLACKSLWDGECELAVAGGVNLILVPEVFASFAKTGLLSPDGRCKAFDAQADGYVRGEGAGMLALKPLSSAMADGDPIYAVIRGGAVNQDGRTNGLTAPNRLAQEAVLRAAYRQAGVSPGQIDYIEAMGTGTLLGDPIELGALAAVLVEGRDLDRRCALGSVKTNIGHLEAAAGVAGLIKTALALHHRRIPPSLHFSQPNPHIAFDEIPVQVQRKIDAWPDSGRPSLAGVSSFGFGGTNAHLVLEQAPGFQDVRPVAGCGEREEVVVPLSAKCPAALWDLALAMRTELSDGSCDLGLVDLAYTAGARRGHHDHRLVLVVSSRDEVVEALDAYRRGEPHLSSIAGRRISGRRPRTVFVFSGQGGLWQGAGRTLFEREPAFRGAIERCDAILSRHLGCSPAAELLADGSSSRIGDPEVDRAVQFTLQVGLAALWKSWGIVPERSVGDGIGEVTAAYVAGSLSLEDAAAILARGQADAASPARWIPSMPRFSEAIAGLAKEGFEVFLEVGPHPILASAVKESLGPRGATSLVLPSLRRGDAGLGSLRWSAAFLYARGFDLNWAWVSPPGRFVRLPGYPWQRERFWLDDGDNQLRTSTVRTRDRKDGLESPAHQGNGKTNGRSGAPVRRLQAPVEIQCEPPQELPTVLREFVAPPSVVAHPRGPSDLSTEVQHDRFIQELRERVADVLGMASDKVDPDRPLLSMGLDSLTAVDLKVEIETSLGVTLPLSRLLEGATIRDLADGAIAQGVGTPSGPLEPAVVSVPGVVPDPPAIPEPAPGQSGQPLSYGQQMLWYAHQFTRTGAAYHVTGAGLVRAELDIDALRRAFRRVVARQEALRTTFTVDDEKPAVRLLDLDELVRREDEWLPIEDVSDHGGADLQKKLTELSGQLFDMEKGPLFRVHVLSRSTTEHVFLLVFHHIIADFWSTAVFLDDFKTAYTAELAGRGTTLPAPRSCYADFARWQHTMLASDEGERHWAYWRDQLAGTLPVLDLPTDFTRPPVQSYRGGVRHFYLEPALTRAIVTLSESRGASLYTTLLAAFHVLLGRFSGQHDIVVGTPVAGRTRPGLHELVGYFVNMLPMRGDLSGNPPFDEFLARVRRTVTNGLEHQDYPFSLLVRRLQGNPDPSRPPLFQAMFAHQKIQPLDEQGLAPFALGIPGARLNLHGLAVDSIAFERQTALFDLTMMTAREADRLCVALEYSTDLFKESTIDRMAASFRNLLEAIVADPGRRIADLPLLSGTERHQVLVEWASSPGITPGDLAIHHRFERQVDESPDAIALVFGEESLTYRELNLLSNSLAHRLIDLGVKPEAVVGLCFDRWPSRVIGLLSVLKAGGAYVPLDPDHPAERLVAILRDSRASVLLTEDHLRDRLDASAVPVVTLDALGKSLGEEDPGNPSVCVNPKNLAYVIFTSGTTGRPKGVMVSHGALLAGAAAWESAYSLRRPPLRHLQAAGFSFDVFTEDWVRALTTGGTLVACPRPVLLDPAALADLIRRERIECLELVPALADTLAAHLERQGEDLDSVRLLTVGADTVRWRLYRRLCRLVGPGGRVVNSYGLTETTIDNTYFGGPPENHEGDGSVPIGKPFPGTRAYVLNERLEPVPSGVLGDLFIGGSGVARGYVADPRQTAERFLPDPFGNSPGGRLYRTGDLARWRPDGSLECLGRVDHQVKIRGFRVELGEIEAALVRHTSVREAVVVGRPDATGETSLAAYIVPGRGLDPITTADLRRWLVGLVPEYMVPTAFVILESLPLTPNGKVDRQALPNPAGARLASSAHFVPPRGPIEEALAEIWTELLGGVPVGAHDNFFERGGHSLLATRVISRLCEATGVKIPLRALFESPTVAGMAKWIETARRADARSESVPIKPGDRIGPQPLSFSQEGLWFLDQVAPGLPTFNVTAALRITGPLDQGALQRSLSELVRRHESLRTTFVTIDGTPHQVIAQDLDLSLDTDDLTGLPSGHRQAEVERRAIEDARRPFDLARGPLARVSLLRLGDGEHAVLLTVHHIITDGWSLSVAASELVTLYESDRRGGSSPIPLPPIQYADFARWQREQFATGAWKSQIDRWRSRLAGVPPLELPTDRPRPPIRSARGALHPLVLSPELSQAVRALGRREECTPFMILLAAFQLLLGRWSGQDDFAIGSPVANRTKGETERCLGYFVNMLALRADLSGNPTVREFLARVREVALEAFENQEIPLEVLIPTLGPRRDASRSPLFQVMFVLQNNARPMRPLDLTLSPLDLDQGTGTSKFDLTLGFEDRPETFAGFVEFNTDLFGTSTIERFSRHYVEVLESFVAHPQRRLFELSFLPDDERREALAWSHEPWVESEGLHTHDRLALQGIHSRFELQVRATPDGVALVADDKRLSYAELNARANRLARHLRSQGAGPEVRIGLVLDDPIHRIVAVLGVLKAGGAYVPLEPSLPRLRLEGMLDAACVSIVVVDRGALDRAPRSSATTTIELDADWATVAVESLEDPSVRVDGENVAYVVFTSGTTGRPKGVMVSHRSLLAAAAAWELAYELRRPPLRHLQAAGFAFDVFTGDWIRALTTGGTLVACPRPVLLDPAALADLIRRERIECLELVPALADALAAHLEREGQHLDCVRLLAVGSDTLRGRLYRRLCKLVGPGGRVVNSYGMTEATIDSTYFGGPLADSEGDGPVPIGRPMPGTQAYVLDGRGELVPKGLVGELYVGGSGVARGYVADPRQTAERFVPDPHGGPGSRMYATGDRARWREGGVLELLGRRDGQVKVRGFRVELAEVEAALRRHPRVGEAVVETRNDTTGNQRLVAYIVPHTAADLEVAELRRLLHAELPEYMVPSAFVMLEALPLSSNGKIDRKALPAPGPGPLDSVVEYVAPRNPLEETLVRVWAEVLELERVGVHDNFFDLGGHSLQSVQLVSRLTAALNRPVSVKTVFLAPTVAAMADVLEREAAAAGSGDRLHRDGDAPAALARRLLESEPAVLPDHVTTERRPFLSLFASAELAPVESVALGYLPSALLHFAGLDRATVIHAWCGNRPLITEVRETPLGRIGSVLIPRFDDQLYHDRRDLLAVLGDAVQIAHEIGAATVSLTGLLPSASDYGRDLAKALAGHDLPRITTGHATTTSAVVLAVRRALEEGGRALAGEHVGFIGLGSVGLATLRLLLSCLPHPARLSLCDVYSKQEILESLRRELSDELGYGGEVRLLVSRHEVPAELYEASLIVGATNVAEILDIDRVAPGTIVVDDSAPHAFHPEEALRRFRERGDILVTEGGVLLAPEPLPLRVYVPDGLEPRLKAGLVSLIARSNPWNITGCVLSGLLSARFAHLAPTVGLIDRQTALDHYETLDALGFKAAGLELDDSPLDARIIRDFRSRYGNGHPSGHANGNGRDRSVSQH